MTAPLVFCRANPDPHPRDADCTGVTYLTAPRTSQREPGDFVLGCGQPAAGQHSGRACAGTGAQLSCQLCPPSPSYFRGTERVA